MSDLQQKLFGPLSKQYCLYFYILSVLGLAFVVIVLVSAIAFGISKKKGIEFYVSALVGTLGYAIFYFQNRLLYNMCAGST